MKNKEYIDISKAFSSSHLGKVGASTTFNSFVPINKIAELKGLKSNRSLRLAIQKGKYIARVVKVFGGKTYEILYSSLEPEIQEKLQDELIKEATQSNCTALVPINNINNNINNNNFITESAKLTALARVDIVKALQNIRTKYKTKKEADSIFLDLYNSGMYLPKIHKFIGSISIGTLHRWIWAYEDNEDYRVLLPNYKYTKQGEYNTILTQEMKDIFIKFLLHPNKFSVTKAIKLTQHILEKKGIENIPHIITFRRYAEHYKKNNYSRWILFREGEKAYHDKIEPYIERDISKLEVGDVLIADGHTLNFQVINPFTGKPTRATLVGFLDWKSTALVGYEIMMSENTQCIASALRNAIINLGMIPKVIYQDNGKAFKAKYFHDKQGEKNLSRSLTGARCDFLAQALKNQHTCQSCDCLFGGVKRVRSSKAADFSPLPPSRFDEEGFNGIYAKLTIKLIFIKSYNVTDNFFVFVFLYICVLRFRMCELMIHTIPHVYNKVTGTTSSESAVQVASALAVPEKKDSFEKSNSKMLTATSAATIGGGVIGAIFAKMTEATRRVPNSILKKYNLDFGKYGSARAKIEALVSEEEITPLLKSLANKLLNNEELTPYELELAKKIDLEPNMVRFLDSAKERAKILLDEINKHPKSLGDAIGGYSVLSTCFDRNSLNMQVDFAKRLCSIEENGLRYSNNEEFLNYLSSEFFKGITFKIKYDKNGIEKDIVPSLNFKEALSNGDILSDATYTYKELVDKIIIKNEFNRNLSQTNLSLLPLTIFDSKNYNHIPSGQKLTEYYLMVCNAAVDKAKAANDELKNSAIKAYNNKQILKSAGIGVLVTGAVALCAALICRKDKEKE